MKGLVIILVWVGLLLGMPAEAAHVRQLELHHEGNGYRLTMVADLAAPIAAVRHVLTDFSNLKRVSESVLESEVLGVEADKTVRVRTLSHFCVWFFCKDLEQVQLVREPYYGKFEARTIPARSDLDSGHASWRVAQTPDGTELSMELEMQPSFWVPPLFGPLMIASALRKEAVRVVQGVERRALRPGANGRALKGHLAVD